MCKRIKLIPHFFHVELLKNAVECFTNQNLLFAGILPTIFNKKFIFLIIEMYLFNVAIFF